VRTAAALVIGNELLTGKIADANIVVLARELRSLGIVLRRVVMILDEIDVIAREVIELSSSHDVLVTSGGVGPTHDDLTIEAVARAFDVPMIVDPSLEKMLRSYYGDRVTEGHLLMSRIPEGARLVSSNEMPWPAVVMQNVWVLPGVPEIFRLKLALLRRELGEDTPFISLSVYTTLDEGQLKALLDEVVAAHPEVEIGSYPKWNDPEYKTKLTFDGTDRERVQAAREAFTRGLPEGALVPGTAGS